MKPIKPLKNNVLIKRCKPAETSHGGIVLPPHYRETIPRYEVVSVGPKCSTLKPGDIVLNPENEGQALKYAGQPYVLVNENRIPAKEI